MNKGSGCGLSNSSVEFGGYLMELLVERVVPGGEKRESSVANSEVGVLKATWFGVLMWEGQRHILL